MPAPDLKPHSIEAEQAVIGAMLIDSDKVIELIATLQPRDFFDPVHRDIFQAIAELSEDRKPIDLLTVAEHLKGNEPFEAASGSAYLAELTTAVPTSANAEAYAKIVSDKALKRAVSQAGNAIATLAGDEKIHGIEALEQAEKHILAISRQSSDGKPQHIIDIGTEAYERYAEAHQAADSDVVRGLRTGFADIDKLDVLEPSSFIVIAARPSMGKTSLALTIARNVANDGKNVAVFSLEMCKRKLMDRIISGLLGVETWRLTKGELTEAEFQRMGKVFDGLKEHPLYIDDDPDTTIANLRSKARRQQMEHGLDLLIIDYLQLIEVTDRSAGENRQQQVTHISRSLKNLARELHCPVIALSQLSRLVEQRSPPIPILSDLRDSGSIEQDADLVLMLYREEAYNPDCDSPGVTDAFVRKNRNGPTGLVSLFFDAERMAFTPIEKRHTASVHV